MERLTFAGNFCDIAQCRENPCPYNGSCSQRKVWERLKQFEDTELTPEEIDMDHEAAEALARICQYCDLDRLDELAKADKEGRVVVMPEAQEVVFTNADRVRKMSDEDLAKFMLSGCGAAYCKNNDRDSTCYLRGNGRMTACELCALDWLREEAEKALRRPQ